VRDTIEGRELLVLATEPTACPTLTRGPHVYDFGDVAMTTPPDKVASLLDLLARVRCETGTRTQRTPDWQEAGRRSRPPEK
jgi:hypothetical protein